MHDDLLTRIKLTDRSRPECQTAATLVGVRYCSRDHSACVLTKACCAAVLLCCTADRHAPLPRVCNEARHYCLPLLHATSACQGDGLVRPLHPRHTVVPPALCSTTSAHCSTACTAVQYNKCRHRLSAERQHCRDLWKQYRHCTVLCTARVSIANSVTMTQMQPVTHTVVTSLCDLRKQCRIRA